MRWEGSNLRTTLINGLDKSLVVISIDFQVNVQSMQNASREVYDHIGSSIPCRAQRNFEKVFLSIQRAPYKIAAKNRNRGLLQRAQDSIERGAGSWLSLKQHWNTTNIGSSADVWKSVIRVLYEFGERDWAVTVVLSHRKSWLENAGARFHIARNSLIEAVVSGTSHSKDNFTSIPSGNVTFLDRNITKAQSTS